MKITRYLGLFGTGILLSASWALPAAAQGQYPPPQQQAPPDQGPYSNQSQYPPQTQYPPQAQYPPVDGQYPPPQNAPYPLQPQAPPPQGQYQPPPPAAQPPQQLDQIVGPVALYPDGLLAQLLTASTYPSELPEAAAWSNQHSYLHGPALAQAIDSDRLPFDPSVIALLPFPQALNQLANNLGWTQQLGNAVLVQRADVMDAVQRMRQRAYQYGYLQSSQYLHVIADPGYIQILPANPDYYYVPFYYPAIVYARPRPGFFTAGALHFGPAITVGAAFAPWGWGGVGFGWREHTILVGNRPWARDWHDRAYARPYVAGPGPRFERDRVERHELRGPARYEEHRDERHDGHRDRR